MRDEYDFTEGERGKFYQPGTKLHFPVYLDDEVMMYLRERALAKGTDVNRLVNDMLKREIDLIEAVK